MKKGATEQWSVLDTGVRTVAENIALDDTLLVCRNKDLIPNTLRFLQFSPRAVLVGFHQSVEQEVRVEYCQQHGIDINRRVTGGGAIYLDPPQLGWEVIASRYHPMIPKGVEELYKLVCEGAVKGLKRLGVQASFRPKNDIEVNGRKISGTGGSFENNAFLFQGTLLTDFEVDTMLRALRIPIEKLKDKELQSARERVTCLKWELGYLPDIETIKAALREGFSEVFSVEFKERNLTESEKKIFQEKINFYRSDEWVYSIRKPMKHRQVFQSAYKAPGGLIRVSLIVDIPNKRIQAALITGDFFAYPPRTILDLESLLKDSSMEDAEVEKRIVQFFDTHEVQIPGVAPMDFVKAIRKATEKVDYLSFGIPLEEVNNVFTVVDSLKNIKNPPVLLVPYCAKLPDCEYRQQKGCSQCGKCSVSDVYELAEKKNMAPITIVNFDDLLQTLNDLKKKGVQAFVGSCCEAFYVKHLEDFQTVGLPGILINVDNQTCYDLGKEKEAKKGKFESQTDLKIDLIKRILDRLR